MRDIWNDKYVLADMLFDTNKSLDEIAEYFETTKSIVCNQIKLLGLEWVRRSDHKVSRGQSSLTCQLKKLLPRENIVNEYQLGDRLRIDVYCPAYKLAVEYHGRQHYEWISMFHPTYDDFKRAQQRDEDKLTMCKEQGIVLVAFRYDDDLSEDAVFDRILSALKTAEPVALKPKMIPTYKTSPQYQEAKLKRNQYAKALRKKIKQERKVRQKAKEDEDY